ncbi:MAG: hypothetical protein HYS18_09250 [Burkholderiales bacterium]|nr:hypothetical protein [Burkholderiales bacterium]
MVMLAVDSTRNTLKKKEITRYFIIAHCSNQRESPELIAFAQCMGDYVKSKGKLLRLGRIMAIAAISGGVKGLPNNAQVFPHIGNTILRREFNRLHAESDNPSR